MTLAKKILAEMHRGAESARAHAAAAEASAKFALTSEKRQ